VQPARAVDLDGVVMSVSIRDARHSAADRQFIQKAFADYLTDLTDLNMNTGMFPAFSTSDGEFGDRKTELFARWFADDSSHPLVILRDNVPVGFALVSRPVMKRANSADHRLAEFFVAKQARRRGVGREAAELIFNRFGGSWEVTEILRNQTAVAFWRNVVGAYTGGDYREAVGNGEVRHVFQTQKISAQRRAR
jgi:predicted acetyltransferase